MRFGSAFDGCRSDVLPMQRAAPIRRNMDRSADLAGHHRPCMVRASSVGIRIMTKPLVLVAIVLGVVAILVGVFFFTLSLAMN